MDISVPSRYACLPVEDKESLLKPKKNKNDKQKSRDNNPKKSTKQMQVKKEKRKKKEASQTQWEEWKVKDDQLVNGHYENDLESALLLSKLDFEKQNKDPVKTENKKNDSKKKKNKVMTLDQFLATSAGEERTSNNTLSENKTNEEKNFFEKVQLQVQEQIVKAKISERRKEREANIEEIITISQYQAKLEKEIKKNESLDKELDKLRSEIASVKLRNKTLCGILGHGEMKEKADVLLELERLNIVKNELTEEVSKLHGLLEQERSKVANLTADLNHQNKYKEKKKKQHAV